MKNMLLLLSFLPLPYFLNAQPPNYEDLLVLYVDGEYEKCIKRSEKYIDDSDTRRDPLPYLYASKCYHEMSKLEEFTSQEEYRKADRDALKYAVKYRKKDKDLAYFHVHEDYWRELNKYAMDMGLMWYDQGEYSKARQIFSRMVGYDPQNPGAWQMLALTQAKARMLRDAKESMATAQELLETARSKDPDLGSLTKNKRSLWETALQNYDEYLKENGEPIL
jgi:tetratricopeptide (TPR) repeat protein